MLILFRSSVLLNSSNFKLCGNSNSNCKGSTIVSFCIVSRFEETGHLKTMAI